MKYVSDSEYKRLQLVQRQAEYACCVAAERLADAVCANFPPHEVEALKAAYLAARHESIRALDELHNS